MQKPSLNARFPYQFNITLRQVTHAPMHQFSTPAGRALRKIRLLHQQGFVTPHGSIKGDAQTSGTATNYQQVPLLYRSYPL